MNLLTREPKHVYPPQVVVRVIRIALIVLAVILLVVSTKVQSYAALPSPWHRAPFVASSCVAVIWAIFICRPLAIIWCSALLGVAFVMRGVELTLWGPNQVKVVAAGTWILLGVWTFLLGVINQVVVTQQKAGELWECSLKE